VAVAENTLRGLHSKLLVRKVISRSSPSISTSATTPAHQFRRGFVLVAQDDHFFAQNLRVFGGRHFSHLLNRMWVLAAALHRRYLAQSRQLATSSIVVLSII